MPLNRLDSKPFQRHAQFRTDVAADTCSYREFDSVSGVLLTSRTTTWTAGRAKYEAMLASGNWTETNRDEALPADYTRGRSKLFKTR